MLGMIIIISLQYHNNYHCSFARPNIYYFETQLYYSTDYNSSNPSATTGFTNRRSPSSASSEIPNPRTRDYICPRLHLQVCSLNVLNIKTNPDLPIFDSLTTYYHSQYHSAQVLPPPPTFTPHPRAHLPYYHL